MSINQGRRGGTQEWVVNPTLNYRGYGGTLYTATIELDNIASIEEENNSGQRGELVNPTLKYRGDGGTLYKAVDK